MILTRIEALTESLRRSERRVADLVLTRPAVVARSSINDIAGGAGVSEPTVVRFCRAVGCSGFQDLKHQIARDLGRLAPDARDEPDRASQPNAFEAAALALDAVSAAIERARAELTPETLGPAAELLARTPQVWVWAEGEQEACARRAADRLARSGWRAQAWSGAAALAGAAGAAGEDVLILALDDPAASPAGLAALADARAAGAASLCVGPGDGASAAACSLALPTPARGIGGPWSVGADAIVLSTVTEALRLAALAVREAAA